MEVLLMDDTKQKERSTFQDIYERDEVVEWKYQAYTGFLLRKRWVKEMTIC